MRLTEKSVAKLALATDKPYRVNDDVQDSLLVLVSKRSKTYYFRYGKLIKSLGTVEKISLEDARNQCKKFLGELASGTNPLEQSSARRHSSTINEIWAWYFDNEVRGRKKSWRRNERDFDRFIRTTLGTKRIVDVASHHVRDWFNKITRENGELSANRIRSLLSRIFSVAYDHFGYSKISPVKSVKPHNENKWQRHRILSSEELDRLWKVLREDKTYWGDYFMLLILTAQRRSTIAGLRWSEVNLSDGYLSIGAERMKSGRNHRLALSAQSLEILRRRKSIVGDDSPFVFPTAPSQKGGKKSKTGHIVDPHFKWEEFVKSAKINERTTIHDIRRTSSTAMLKTTPLPIIQSILNHAHIKTTMTYLVSDIEDQRKYIDAMNEKIGK